MSRRSPRVRARLRVTVQLDASGDMLVCQTRDISREGCFLDTVDPLPNGGDITLAVMDPSRGEAFSMAGQIRRTLVPGVDGASAGVGVFLPAPPDAWIALVARHETKRTLPGTGLATAVHLRVVVFGDDARRRGALALYVTSGWDVRFASTISGVREALSSARVHAVIAETDLADPRWREILTIARDTQPGARRIVRSHLRGAPAPSSSSHTDLVQRVVDLDAGMDALLDALTADFGGR